MNGFGSVGLKVERRGGKIPKLGSKTHPLKGLKGMEVPKAMNELAQSDAKLYLPPDAYIWRLNKRGAWGCTVGRHHDHIEPWSRHSNDSSKAMWACVRFAWRIYLEDQSLPAEHCPIKGLL